MATAMPMQLQLMLFLTFILLTRSNCLTSTMIRNNQSLKSLSTIFMYFI